MPRTTRRPLRSLQTVTKLDGSVSAFVGLGACCPFPARPDRPGPRPPPRTSERTSHDRARWLPAAALLSASPTPASLLTTAVAGVTAAIVLSVATPPLTVLSPGAGCCRPARITRPAPGLLHRPGTGPPGLTSSHRQAHEPGDYCSPDSPTNASSAAASVKHLVSSSRTACGKPRNRARSSPGTPPGSPSAFFPRHDRPTGWGSPNRTTRPATAQRGNPAAETAPAYRTSRKSLVLRRKLPVRRSGTREEHAP